MKNSTLACVLALAPMALVGGVAATTVATPVYAAKSPDIVCPAGWHRVKAYNGTQRCEKDSVVYTEPSTFASTSGTLQKTNKTDRCPTGWNTNGDGMECITQHQDKPSLSRPKDGKACKANEVDEWGVWCTSNYEGLTMEVMRGAAMRDYNKMYGINRAVVPTFAGAELDDKLMTPVARKVFGDKWPDQKAVASGEQSGTAASNADTPVKSCETAVEQGAAVGGAVAGTKGKVIGGLAGAAIGGLGKKKKKSGC